MKKKGFTFIELIIAMALVSLLVATAGPILTQTFNHSHKAKQLVKQERTLHNICEMMLSQQYGIEELKAEAVDRDYALKVTNHGSWIKLTLLNVGNGEEITYEIYSEKRIHLD